MTDQELVSTAFWPRKRARNHAISGGYQGVLLLPLPLPLLLLLHGIPVCRAGE